MSRYEYFYERMRNNSDYWDESGKFKHDSDFDIRRRRLTRTEGGRRKVVEEAYERHARRHTYFPEPERAPQLPAEQGSRPRSFTSPKYTPDPRNGAMGPQQMKMARAFPVPSRNASAAQWARYYQRRYGKDAMRYLGRMANQAKRFGHLGRFLDAMSMLEGWMGVQPGQPTKEVMQLGHWKATPTSPCSGAVDWTHTRTATGIGLFQGNCLTGQACGSACYPNGTPIPTSIARIYMAKRPTPTSNYNHLRSYYRDVGSWHEPWPTLRVWPRVGERRANPNHIRNLPASPQPVPAPVYEASPRPNPFPKPQAFSGRPGGPSSPAKTSERQPPTRGKKDEKALTRSAKFGIALAKALDVTSEWSETVNAFYEALPAHRQTCKGGLKGLTANQFGQYGIDGADCKLQVLYRHWREVDTPKALRGIMANAFEDQVYGQYHKRVQRGHGGVWQNDASKEFGKQFNAFMESFGF